MGTCTCPPEMFLVIFNYIFYVSGPVSVSATDADPSFNILRNLSISASVSLLSEFERDDTLMYTYTLEINSTSEPPITTSIDSLIFDNTFTCDTCYRVSYSVDNCAGGSGTLNSNYFILQGTCTIPKFTFPLTNNSISLGVRGTTGYFIQNPLDPKHIEWVYNSTLDCGNYEQNYLPDDYISFSIVNRLTGDISNVTNSGLNLPDGFFVDIPEHIDVLTENFALRIEFDDPCLNVTIPIIIITATSKFTYGDNVLLINYILFVSSLDTDNTLTIILGVFFALLLTLLIVLVIITIAFVVIYYKKRSNDKK